MGLLVQVLMYFMLALGVIQLFERNIDWAVMWLLIGAGLFILVKFYV
ncbi:hypothetical protein [Brochothrix thermosphacta]|nr:hypothetical protein [Brochothrix thermosphacta]